jgi:lysyl-tRNA synthetase class 2
MKENEILAGKFKTLKIRSRIIQTIRDFFIGRDYLEIDTPIRIPAPAPESHIDAIPTESWFLHTSPELCMKRLLAAGYPRIFQICKCFRNAERGNRHLPEFTMLEWYRSGIDYFELMRECEDLLVSISQNVFGADTIRFPGKEIQLSPPWERISVEEAFQRYTSVPMEKALKENTFNEIMAFEIEPNLGRLKPAFLYDYPVSLGALARKSRRDPTVAERFELYIDGVELVNAFSELTDPEEQRMRFSQEQRYREACGKTVYPDAEKFLSCLQDMPESAGAALGVDRLCMIFSNTDEIDQVVAFTMEEL